MLRYVVLHHTGYGEDHYDLMFETAPGSMLATWRSPCWPLQEIHTPLELLPDHRRDYLDYEGPVSGGRGSVRRVQAGTHTVHSDHPILLIVNLENGDCLRLFRGTSPAVQTLRAR